MDRELPTPPADVKALIERVRSALAAHHDWHLQAGEMAIAKDENGEPIWLDLGLEYQDSSLYKRTADAIAALSSLNWRPSREQIARALARYYHPDEPDTPDLWELYYPEADIFLALTPEAE